MGWFDEQIRLRKLNDEVLLEESFLDMAGSVMGRQLQASLESNRIRTKNAIAAGIFLTISRNLMISLIICWSPTALCEGLSVFRRDGTRTRPVLCL